jgi:hypothetical protein
MNSAPLTIVAIAGHVLGSDVYCDCGTPNCVCGSGQTSVSQSTHTVSDARSIPQDSPAGLGAEALFALAIIMLWLRLRA